MDNKHKVIIDTDPGIDDTTALIFTMFDERLDVKLYVTVKGNIKVDIATNNMLHLLEKFGKNTPVARGSEKALFRDSADAAWLHGEHGMGPTYIPPKAKTQPIKEDALNAMARIIRENPHEVTLLMFGPHTNIGKLLWQYPDVIPLIKQIIFEGFAPFALPGWGEHISFNISTDPEAAKIIIDSGIPLVIIPSVLGREYTHLTQNMIEEIGTMNDTGKFLEEIYQTYWEHGYPDKRIATNDTDAYLYLVEPELFTTKRVDVAVSLNEDDIPGKTYATPHSGGNVKLVTGVNRKAFEKSFMAKIRMLDHIKLK